MIDLLAARAPAVKPPRGVLAPGGPLDGAAAGRRRPLSTPPRARRVSGPARRKRAGTRSPARAARRRRTLGRGAALGSVLRFPAEVLGWLRLLRLRWAERLSRRRLAGALRAAILGRTWIALVAFALIGIVTLQLGLLKLNASIGRGLEHEALLQRENAALSIENSETDATASVQSRAERMGMELVPAGSLRFLSARPGSDTNGAAAALSAPIGTSAAGSAEAPAAAGQGQAGASAAGIAAAPAASEAHSTEAATPPSGAGSQSTPTSEPGASGTASSPAPAASAPEAAKGPTEQAAAPSPAGAPSAGAPAAGGSGEAPPGGGTQSAGAGG